MKRRAPCAIMVLLTAVPCAAQVTRVADLNTAQIRALDRSKTVVLLPGGILEEHGPLRAIFMDLADELGDQGFRWILVVHVHGAPLHNRALDQASDYFQDVHRGRMEHLWGQVPVLAGWGNALQDLTDVQSFGFRALGLNNIDLTLDDLEYDFTTGCGGPSEPPCPVVPEPATMAMMGIGLLGLGFLGRRMRK